MRTKIVLSPDTELEVIGGFEELYKGKGNIKVIDILSELQKKFPKGFYARDATAHLKEVYGGNLKLDDWGHNHAVYMALAQQGYLKILRTEKPRFNQRKRWGQHHFYTVNQDDDRILKMDVPYNLSIPPGLNRLMASRANLTGVVDKDEVMIGALENMVLADNGFLRIMEKMKRESPQVYVKMGGTYLDSLLERRAPR